MVQASVSQVPGSYAINTEIVVYLKFFNYDAMCLESLPNMVQELSNKLRRCLNVVLRILLELKLPT